MSLIFTRVGHGMGRTGARLPQQSMPTKTSLLRAALVCFVSWGAAGCSFLFVTPPPKAASPQRPEASASPPRDCTTSNTAPVLDVIAAGLQVVRTVYAITASNSVYQDPNVPLSREADIAFGAGFTLLYSSSAAYGFSHTSACRKLKESGWDVNGYAPPPDWMLGKTEGESTGKPTSQPTQTPSPVPPPPPAPTHDVYPN